MQICGDYFNLGRVAKWFKELRSNCKVPSSNPIGHSTWLSDPTSLSGARSPLGQNVVGPTH